MLGIMTAIIVPVDSSIVVGVVVKKNVSFADKLVTDVYAVERKDKTLNRDLFYSPEDFRRFKQERRMTQLKSQRMACRSKSRRRGVMYETVMPIKGASASSIDYRVTNMSLMMEFECEVHPEQQAF